mmetsp:Transcript_27329/g.69006  ORF Transcript_27329/g.69006 Transcript_27329/m.69006 type:complete len:361 (+) Transcript_27329:525-1607(+)
MITHQILVVKKLVALVSDLKTYATQCFQGEWPRKGGKPVMASLTHVVQRLGATRDCFEETRSAAGPNPSFVELIGVPVSDPLGVARAANAIVLDSDFWGSRCSRRQNCMVDELDSAALPGSAARERVVGGCADGTGHQVHPPWADVKFLNHPPPIAAGGTASSQAPPHAARAATRAQHQHAIKENAPAFKPPGPAGASQSLLAFFWKRGLRIGHAPAAEIAAAALQGAAAVLPGVCADSLVGGELLLAIFLFYLSGPILTRIADATNAHAREQVIPGQFRLSACRACRRRRAGSWVGPRLSSRSSSRARGGRGERRGAARRRIDLRAGPVRASEFRVYKIEHFFHFEAEILARADSPPRH